MQASSSYPQILGQLIWFCLPSHEGPLLDNNHRTIHGIMLGSLACKQIYLTSGLDAIDLNNQMSWPILFTLGQQIITHTWFAQTFLSATEPSFLGLSMRVEVVRPLNLGDWRFRHEDDSIAWACSIHTDYSSLFRNKRFALNLML